MSSFVNTMKTTMASSPLALCVHNTFRYYILESNTIGDSRHTILDRVENRLVPSSESSSFFANFDEAIAKVNELENK